MNVIILPGNSPRHTAWSEALKAALTTQDPQSNRRVIAHSYLHWDTGETWADIDEELSRVVAVVKNIEPYIIIAKSIGSIIALKGVGKGELKPSKIVLLGVPLELALKHDAKQWVSSITAPVLVAQNSDDPFGSFHDVHSYLETKNESTHLSFIELPGSTHDYVDFPGIMKYL